MTQIPVEPDGEIRYRLVQPAMKLFATPSRPNRRTRRRANTLTYRFRLAGVLFGLTFAVGAIGFKLILHDSWINAIYFTVVTLSTVGYGDVVPAGLQGHLFTTLFILGGLATASYSAAILMGAFIEGEIQGEIGARWMRNKIDRLSNHVVLCGYGRVGREIAEKFRSEKLPFVVIEKNVEHAREAENNGDLVLVGDGTKDELLIDAGVERASSAVIALPDDASNLFIVLSARQLNKGLHIVARASEKSTEEKLRMAGANLVVRPSYMGANRLAQSILRPTVSDFIEVAGKGNSSEYTMEEIPISPNSDFANHRLMELNLPQRLDVIVIGIKRIDGEFSFNPSGQTALHAGDTILALGDTDRLDKLKKLAAAETESKAKSKSSTT